MMTKIYHSFIVAIAILVAGCAASANKHSELYKFPDLQEVSSIDNFRMNGWEYIDKYSLFINSGPKKSYLVIFNGPSNDLKFAQRLQVSSKLGRVEVGFDNIVVGDNPDIKYNIKRMYLIKDKEEKKAIKQQILAFDDKNKK